MALSKKEQAELEALEKEVGSALSPEEEAELAQLESEVGNAPKEQPSSLKGYAKGALDALPVVMGTAGGILGSPGGPVTGVAGAGAGAYAGGVLKRLGYTAMGEPPSRDDALIGPFKEGMENALFERGGQLVTKGIGKVIDSPIGQKVISKGKGLIGKVGEALTGVPKKQISTYIDRGPQINRMITDSAGSTPLAADEMRYGWNRDIQNTKNAMNKKITDLTTVSGQRINPEEIYTELELVKNQLNPKTAADQIAEIEGMQNTLMDMVGLGKATDNAGTISVKEAADFQKYLKPKAQSQYIDGTGKMFATGDDTARAAKAGQRATRKAMGMAEPGIGEANLKLSKLHKLEKTMNRNMLKEGATEHSILAAGGGNERAADNLRKLDEITGSNAVKDAENLSAMQTFKDPPFLPMDTTGKASARMGVGGGLGGGVMGLLTDFNPAMMTVGTFLGSAATSPKALKAGLDLTRLSAQELNMVLQSPELMALALRGAKNAVQTKQSKE